MDCRGWSACYNSLLEIVKAALDIRPAWVQSPSLDYPIFMPRHIVGHIFFVVENKRMFSDKKVISGEKHLPNIFHKVDLRGYDVFRKRDGFHPRLSTTFALTALSLETLRFDRVYMRLIDQHDCADIRRAGPPLMG